MRIRSAVEPPVAGVVAADGSARGRSIASAWLSDTGAWGIRVELSGLGASAGAAAVVAEVRAIALAAAQIPGRLHVLSDSTSAVDLVRAWTEGDLQPVPNYHGRALVEFARRLRWRRAPLTVEWVRGHDLHPLNEGADALARLASRIHRDRLPKAEVRARAEGLAGAFAGAAT